MRARTAILLSLGVLFVAATPLFPSALDLTLGFNSRANSMAHAGTASAEGAYAIGVNPAGLARINKLQIEATFNPMFVQRTAPANGPMTSIEGSSGMSPLFYIGGAYRISDLITVGLNVFTPAGGGALYEDINYGVPGLAGKDFGGSLFFVEGGPAVAFNLPANLSLGIAYRIDYVKQTFSMYDMSKADQGVFPYQELDVSGNGRQGFRIGLQWDPIERLHIGVSYRNQVEIDTEGTTTLTGAGPAPMELDTEAVGRSADKIIAGITYDIIPGKWLAAVDYMQVKYSNYDKILIKIDMMGQTVETPMYQKYEDSNAVGVGTEYFINPKMPIRAGVHYSASFFNKDYHTPAAGFCPGPTLTLGLGTGYQLTDTITLNVAYNMVKNSGTIEQSDQGLHNVAGDYELDANYFSLQFMYKL